MAKINFDSAKFEKQVNDIVMDIIIVASFEARDAIKEAMRNSPEWTEKTYYRHGRIHHPSMPGNAPRVDWGRLHDSVSVNWYGSGRVYGEVEGRADYAEGVPQPKTPGEVVIGSGVRAKNGWILWHILENGAPKINLKPRPIFKKTSEFYRQIAAKHIKKATSTKNLLEIGKKFIKQ